MKIRITKLEDIRKHGATFEVGKIIDASVYRKTKTTYRAEDANGQEWVFYLGDTCELVDRKKDWDYDCFYQWEDAFMERLKHKGYDGPVDREAFVDNFVENDCPYKIADEFYDEMCG